MAQDSIIQQAMILASNALTKIEEHEKSCDQRYSGIESQVKLILKFLDDKHNAHDERMDKVEKLLWGAAVGAIGALLTACGSMIVMLFKH